MEAQKQFELAGKQAEIARKNYEELLKQKIIAEELARALKEQRQLTESNPQKTK